MPRTSEEAIARNREEARLRAAARREAKREEYNSYQRKYMQGYREENSERINEQRRDNYFGGIEAKESKPFVCWDGEGYDDEHGKHHYMLFGSSRFPDSPITGSDLGTVECLEEIFRVERVIPDAIHVGFAFDYDVNMILRDLPMLKLKHLAVYNVCHWKEYTIRYIPNKMFVVTKKDPETGKKITATIYDVFGFFLSKYTTALIKFGVATEVELAHVIEGKDKRGEFTYEDMEYVLHYWKDELSYFPHLMNTLRNNLYENGYIITRWHGSGAIASFMMRKHGVHKWHSKNVPLEAQIAIQTAYAGGRFSPWWCGLYTETVYTADLNSAYIYACSLLPRLDVGEWRRIPKGHVDRAKLARFGVYHIAYNGDPDKKLFRETIRRKTIAPIYPLFYRDRNRRISWPARVDGWYWTPEASLVADDPNAEFLEAWVFDDDGTSPFQWVTDEFNKRLRLQQEGNPFEKTIKSGLAAIYGATAQRVGWDKKNRKPPPKHELAWAGYITSWCRAAVYKVGKECWLRGGLISIDTDGVTSTIPFKPEWFDTGVGDKLGQWKLEEYSGILQWQSGVHWTRNKNGEWNGAKTRGIKRGSLPIEPALEALANMNFSKGHMQHAILTTKGERFIGFKAALNSDWHRWRTWESSTTDVMMGKGSFTFHDPWYCFKCEYPDAPYMHVLTQLAGDNNGYISQPHYLPWLDDQPHLAHDITIEDDELDIIRDSDERDQL